MTVTTPRARPAPDTPVRHGPSPATGGARRRAPLRIVVGLLVIALGFVIGAVTLSALNKAVDVLAAARTIPAGAALTDADLTVVRIVPDPSLRILPASRRTDIVGQVAAVPLMAGSLLTEQQLGPAADPGPGQSILALGVKPGHAPTGLTAGASVLVLVVPTSTGADAETVKAPAVVRDVARADASGLTVITVQLVSDAAVQVASTTGDVTIVVQGR